MSPCEANRELLNLPEGYSGWQTQGKRGKPSASKLLGEGEQCAPHQASMRSPAYSGLSINKQLL